MDERVAPLVDLAIHVAEQWRALATRWATTGLPEDRPYERLHGATFKELGQRVVATLDQVAALGRVEDAVVVMFLPRIQPAIKQLKNAQAHIGNLLGELSAAPEARFVDPSGTLDVVRGSIDGKHVANANPGNYLEQVSANTAALFDLVSGMLKFGKGKGLSLYQDYGTQLQSLHSNLAGLQADAKSLVASIEGLRGSAEEAAGAAAQSSSKSSGLSKKLDELLDSAQKSQAELEAKLAAAREVSKAATSLETQIEAYETSFDAFQKSLDDRLQQHDAFQKYSAETKAELETREQEIERLTAKSEAMIKGATTAGLGHSLDETRKLYERRMFVNVRASHLDAPVRQVSFGSAQVQQPVADGAIGGVDVEACRIERSAAPSAHGVVLRMGQVLHGSQEVLIATESADILRRASVGAG